MKKKNESAPKYSESEALIFAGKSGTSLKVSVVKSAGIYYARPDILKGTPIVVSAVLATLAPNPTAKVSAEEFLSAFRSLSEDLGGKGSFLNAEIARLVSKSKKPYNNLKTLRSRISGDISRGYTRFFAFEFPESDEVKALYSRKVKSK